jgi:uncharacterized protein (DUF2235 family)
MSKRLVMCCDGTWNRANQPSPTNVWRVWHAIAEKDHVGIEQRPYYHDGVGVKRWEHIRGGAFGFGLSRNVRETYRFIVENFEPGDELFFFGFSRGAFTARSTAGLVRNAGILRPEHARRINEAYELYRRRDAHPRSNEARAFRNAYSHETRVRFIGVWDTVGALGIPLSPTRWVNFINRRWQFHDTDLSTTVRAAFHALAIDEKRGPFQPTIWAQQADAPADQQVEQVWFAGVHCNVGGGYQQRALADIALTWMVDQAQSCGLVMDDTRLRIGELSSMGKLEESRTKLYRLLPLYVRAIGVKDSAHESIASSVVQRKINDPNYTPPGLVAYLAPYRETHVKTSG